MDDGHGVARMLAGLLEASHLATFEQLSFLVAEHACHAGIDEVLIYLCDVRQSVLRLLTGHDKNACEETGAAVAELQVDGTLGGRAF